MLQNPTEATDFSGLQGVQTGFAVDPSFYSVRAGGPSSGGKTLGREIEHHSPSTSKVKNTWRNTSIPPHVFIA
jgi:hypothetical protein